MTIYCHICLSNRVAFFTELTFDNLLPGEKGFPALPSSGSSSLILSSPIPNGYGSNHHPVIQNGIHYVSQGTLPYQKNLSNNTPSIPKVPEPANGFKVSDHSYRRGGQICQSPTYEFNGGTNRASKGYDEKHVVVLYPTFSDHGVEKTVNMGITLIIFQQKQLK